MSPGLDLPAGHYWAECTICREWAVCVYWEDEDGYLCADCGGMVELLITLDDACTAP
jgi:hypothetical protein